MNKHVPQMPPAYELEYQMRELRGVRIAIQYLAIRIAKDYPDDREEAEGIEILCSRFGDLHDEMEATIAGLRAAGRG